MMKMHRLPLPGEYLSACVPRRGAIYIDCTIVEARPTVYRVIEVLLGRRTVSPFQLKPIWRICDGRHDR